MVAPTLEGFRIFVGRDMPITWRLDAHDSDTAPGDLTYTVATGPDGRVGPAHGTLDLDADGGFSYVAAAGFIGADAFTVRVDDGSGGSTTATIEVTVGPDGRDFVTNTTTTAGQTSPAAAGLPDGGFVVTWEDASQSGGDLSGPAVRGQVFGADGAPQGGEFLVNTTTAGYQAEPSVAGLSGGGFVVTWADASQSSDDTSGRAVRGQVFGADGTPQGGEFLVNTTIAGRQESPSVAGLSGGGFVVTWHDASASGSDISSFAVRGQAFGADGMPQGGEFLVNTTTAEGQLNPNVAGLSGGGFVVTWRDYSLSGGDPSGLAVRGQVFGADGAPQGGEFLVNTTTAGPQWQPSVTGLPGGGFVVTWADESASAGDTSDRAVRGQVFGADGTPQGGEFLVNTTIAGPQESPSVAGLTGGGFVVTWTDASQSSDGTSDRAVRGQVFGADGTPQGEEFLVNTTIIAGYQITPSVTALPDGGFAVAWTDASEAGADASLSAIRSRIFDADGRPRGLAATGGAGDDVIQATLGVDHIAGGDGRDTVLYAESAAAVTVDLATGTGQGGDAAGDTLSGIEAVTGSAFADSLTGNGEANLIDGGAGDDSLDGGAGNDVLRAGAGADVLTGGAGLDQANYQGSTAAVSVNLLTGATSGGDAAGDTLTGIENLYGSSNADQLTGDNARNVIGGELGNDTLFGNGGDDSLSGEGGNDALSGGDGADRLVGGAGVDTIHGGIGNDSVDAGSEADQIFGEAGHDNIYGGTGNDQLDGGDGNDTLEGAAGSDTLIGGAGIDTASYAGSAAGVSVNLATGAMSGGDAAGDTLGDTLGGIEQVLGSAFADMLTGDDAANTLWGMAGDDVITGGGNGDALKGGAGSDRFVYTALSDSAVSGLGKDAIRDFSTGDRIDLSAIDADGNSANGDTAFTFGTGDYTRHAGELRVVTYGAVQVAYVDVNGDKVSDLAINVIADHALTAADFLL